MISGVAEVETTEELMRRGKFIDVTNRPSFDNVGNPCVVRVTKEQRGFWYRRDDGYIVVATKQGRILIAKETPEDRSAQAKVIHRMTDDMRVLSIPLEGINPKYLVVS